MAAAANFSPGDQVQGTRSKAVLTLAQLIGRGGEGDVYSVRERSGVLAKLYRTQVDWQLAAKLDHLASRSKPSLRAISAWPEETLRSRSGDPVGFLMPAVSGSEPLHKLTNPMFRRQSFPDASFQFLVEVGINTAQAIQIFHAEDLVVGDINSKNILVSQNGRVTFIDMDSVQVGDGRQFPCTVGVPEYTPPELQGHSLATRRRRRDADLFGLPVIIHQLLATGRHPFDGPADRGRAIKFHYSAFSRLPFRPRPLKLVGLQPEEIFDDRLIEMLRHAFSPTTRFVERPPAKAWVDALKYFPVAPDRLQAQQAASVPHGPSPLPMVRGRKPRQTTDIRSDAVQVHALARSLRRHDAPPARPLRTAGVAGDLCCCATPCLVRYRRAVAHCYAPQLL